MGRVPKPAVHDALIGLFRWGRVAVQGSPKRLLRRKATHLLFAAYAATTLARIEVGLRRSDLPRVCDRLGVSLRSTSPQAPALGLAQWVTVERTAARAIRIVRRWPWGDTCLRRALVIAAVTRDLDPCVVIGVKKSEAGGYLAHAWVEYGGTSIDPTSSEFATFDLGARCPST